MDGSSRGTASAWLERLFGGAHLAVDGGQLAHDGCIVGVWQQHIADAARALQQESDRGARSSR